MTSLDLASSQFTVPTGLPVQPYRTESDLAEAAAGFARASISEATRSGYASDLRQFQRWRAGYEDGVAGDPDVYERVDTCPVGPATVVKFLTDKALSRTTDGSWRYAPSTMARWLAAITRQHVEEGFPSPCAHPSVTAVLSGIRRGHARPPRRAAPLLLDPLRKAILATDICGYPSGIRGTRDVALLLMGFAGAFRRSELAAMTIADVTLHAEDGLHVRVPRSKTDQEAHGAVKGLPFGDNPATCPPCAFRRWYELLAVAGERPAVVMRVLDEQSFTVHICKKTWTTGRVAVAAALFPALSKGGFVKAAGGDPAKFAPMTGGTIAHVVKHRASGAGLDPAQLSGHSLRAGFVTQSIRAGATHSQIMKQTLHKDPATVELYVRENAPLQGSSVTLLGF